MSALKKIRIIDVPPGEAPASIRGAWVGLVLPLAETAYPQPVVSITVGVLGKHRSVLARLKRLLGAAPMEERPSIGYIVNVIDAIEVLRASSPSAAAWWECHTPHLLAPGRRFSFAAHCCQELKEAGAVVPV